MVHPLFQTVFSPRSFPTQLPDSVITHHLNTVHKENYQYFDKKSMFKPHFFSSNLTGALLLGTSLILWVKKMMLSVLCISSERSCLLYSSHFMFPLLLPSQEIPVHLWETSDCRDWISPTNPRHNKYSTALYELVPSSFLNPCPLYECINYMQNWKSFQEQLVCSSWRGS